MTGFRETTGAFCFRDTASTVLASHPTERCPPFTFAKPQPSGNMLGEQVELL